MPNFPENLTPLTRVGLNNKPYFLLDGGKGESDIPVYGKFNAGVPIKRTIDDPEEFPVNYK